LGEKLAYLVEQVEARSITILLVLGEELSHFFIPYDINL